MPTRPGLLVRGGRIGRIVALGSHVWIAKGFVQTSQCSRWRQLPSFSSLQPPSRAEPEAATARRTTVLTKRVGRHEGSCDLSPTPIEPDEEELR